MRSMRALFLAATLAIALASIARAQYVDIPNFTGATAGKQFRDALNKKLNGKDTIAPQLVHLKLATLPATVTNGQVYYLDDGVPGSNPCVAGGAGAVAIGVNGAWSCGASASGAYSVAAFGAKCDGVTDDGVAIQAAFTAAQYARNYVAVILPGGGRCATSVPIGMGGIPVYAYGSGNPGSNNLPTASLIYTGPSAPANPTCAFYDDDDSRGIDYKGPWVLGSGATLLTGVCTSDTAGGGTKAALQPVFEDNTVRNFGASCLDISNAYESHSVNTAYIVRNTIAYCPTGIKGYGGGSITTTLTGQQTLPEGTVTVASTAGFANAANTILIGSTPQIVTCTGVTATTFSGCVGGVGTWAGGTIVQQNGNIVNPVILSNSIGHTGMGIDLGPANTNSEYGEGFALILENEIQNADTVAADSAIVGGIRTGGPTNWVQGNYLSVAAPGPGQTGAGVYDDSWGGTSAEGGNTFVANRCATTQTPASNILSTDTAYLNDNACGAQDQRAAGTEVGSISLARFGVTPPPQLMVKGTPGTASYSASIRCVDQGGNPAGYSAWTTISNAPNTPDGSNYVDVCWPALPQCKGVDIFTDFSGTPPAVPTSAAAVNYPNGKNANNCYPDTTEAQIPYTIGPDQTGGIVETSASAANKLQGTVDIAGTSRVNGYSVLTTAPRQYTLATLPGYANTILAESPAGFWRFGEASGNFTDLSGNSNTATAHATITYSVAGAIVDDCNTAITLDGVGAYASVATSSALPSADVFSVEGWFKRATAGAAQNLVEQGTGGFEIYLNSADKLTLDKRGGANVVASTTAITDTTTWHYFAVSKNAGAVHLYLDGVDVTGSPANQTISPANAALTIGGTSPYWHGSLDEIAVYTTVLSSDQVVADYKEGIATKNGRASYATDVGCTESYVDQQWMTEDCGVGTVAQLPSCNNWTVGGKAVVTDNNAACGTTGFWVAPAGGGSTTCHVRCDGSGWKID